MIEAVIEQRRRLMQGFAFGRVLPAAPRPMVGPFIFFDHMGPSVAGRELDIHPHPHIGLSAVTYLFQGEIVHRDSVGSEQLIRPGEANWMTAGRGITHSERFPTPRSDGVTLHCLQGWVALPNRYEDTDPSFYHYPESQLPTSNVHGVWTRLIAGAAYGLQSPVRIHSPLFLAHQVLESGAQMVLPHEYAERAIYIVSGCIEVDGIRFEARRMLVFSKRGSEVIRALEPSLLVVLGGEPLGERFVEWNFVSSSREKIQQAKHDWRSGKIKLPDFDGRDFIPLPSEPHASLPPT